MAVPCDEGNFWACDDVLSVGLEFCRPRRRGPALLLNESFIRRLLIAALACAAVMMIGAIEGTSVAGAVGYVRGEVIVGYAAGPIPSVTAHLETTMGIRARAAASGRGAKVLHLPRGESVASAIARLRHRPGVVYAEPNFIAHSAGMWYPDDRGTTRRQGWEATQWNFLPGMGVDAPAAWSNMFADHRPGGRGVVVAILDTGVAYRNWHEFRKSPDFGGTRFVDPYDFVANNRYPLDQNGHGTFVAGVVGEATNNGIGLTGLAYGASIMPVRVLDAGGLGDEDTIARGIRYAVTHGAEVINLSLEFAPNEVSSPAQIPDIVSAIDFAHARGVVVVAAAGNDETDQLAYPARTPSVISVGATTRDRCLADYSNGGAGLDLVAPGGGPDAIMPTDPDCHPDRNLPSIYQLTLLDPPHWSEFGYPGGIYGTSMSSPEVAGAAALVIASGVAGRHPTPDQVLQRLEHTAVPLGGAVPNQTYGYGLLDAGAATAKGP
jgi:serine protease